MFDDLAELSKQFLLQDQAYRSEANFETTAGFLKFLANDSDGELSITDEILVLELREGVFIRSKNTAWSERLSGLVDQPVVDYPTIKPFPTKKLDDLTRDYRQPLNALGDYRLIRWKVGF